MDVVRSSARAGIRIRDQGTGEEGAGLGLSIAAAILRAHGGELLITYHPGGSTVTLWFPL